MTVIASGEIDLKLSSKSQAALENQLAKVSNETSKKLEKDLGAAGSAGGANFSKGFSSKFAGLKSSVGDAFKNILNPQNIQVAAGAAAAAIGAFAAKSISHFADTAQSVREFQRVTQFSAEESSHFVAAFDDMNISAEAASGAMFKLAKNVGDGGDKLKELGVKIATTSDGGTDLKETFLNVADAVAKTEDPAVRAEIAMGAFGKTGKNLLPILEKGRAGIEKLFKGADLNFSQKQLDSAEDYRLALDHLDDSVGKVQNRLGAALVPSLAKAAEGTAVLIDKTSSASEKSGILSNALGGVFDTFVPGARTAVDALGLLSDGSDESEASVEQLAGASQALGTSMEGLTGKTKAQVEALLEEKKALDDNYAATLAQFDTNFAYQESLNATEDAASGVAEKQAALNQTLRDHVPTSVEAKAAAEELERALLNQQEQALRSADAAGKLAEQNAILGGAQDATLPKIEAQIAELERQRGQVDGRNTPAIQAMIDKLNEIKAQYVTNVEVNGLDQANTQLSGMQTLLGRIDGSVATATVVVNQRPGNAQSLFPGGPTTSNAPSNRQRLFPQRAAGGPVWGGDWLVGERHNGAELLHLTPGSRGVVTNATQTEKVLSGGKAGVHIEQLNINEVAGDAHATAFAAARVLGERAQR